MNPVPPAADLPMRAAVEAVERAEHEAVAPFEPASFDVEGQVARATRPVSSLDLSRLAHPLARRKRPRAPSSRLVARSRSAVIVLGKYTRDTQVKARAYLGEEVGPATLKVWRSAETEAALGRREREVRARLREIPEFRAPEVLAVGKVGDTDYLLERLVYGRHPLAAEERVAAAQDLLEALSLAYAKHGIEHRALSEMVHPNFPQRLEQAFTSPHLPWSPGWGSRRRLRRRLGRLISRDLALPCSLGHGDLVATNIIRDDACRHVLVDWEQGRVMPVAFDLSKLLFTSGDPAALEPSMAHALQPVSGRGRRHYGWREQLALGVCQRLSTLPRRRRRAEQAGRVTQLEAEVAEQLGWVAALLSR